jgi:hypothetical protein
VDTLPGQAHSVEYILPARRLTGTRAEILNQIDDAIHGLVGLRQLVSLNAPECPEGPPRRRLRVIRSLFAGLLLLAGIALVPASVAGHHRCDLTGSIEMGFSYQRGVLCTISSSSA